MSSRPTDRGRDSPVSPGKRDGRSPIIFNRDSASSPSAAGAAAVSEFKRDDLRVDDVEDTPATAAGASSARLACAASWPRVAPEQLALMWGFCASALRRGAVGYRRRGLGCHSPPAAVRFALWTRGAGIACAAATCTPSPCHACVLLMQNRCCAAALPRCSGVCAAVIIVATLFTHQALAPAMSSDASPPPSPWYCASSPSCSLLYGCGVCGGWHGL
jgi:hypothetical protein